MIKRISKLTWLFLSVLVLGTSCSSDDKDVAVAGDNTQLLETIAMAEELIENATEGTAEGDYLPGSKEELQKSIDLATVVAENESAPQTAIDNANIALESAIKVFESKIVEPIAPEALIAHWSFDEGQGTEVTSVTEMGTMKGIFTAGATANGAGMPQWTTDRHGEANGAIAFDQGANIEVPFSRDLNPGNLTISLWLSSNEVREANYVVSLDRWDGYKLQLQEANKLFFTARALYDGEEVYYDRDNVDPVLEVNTWYHAVVTFGGGHTTFYLNGTQVKDWENTPGDIAQVLEQRNLVIGQVLPSDVINSGEVEWADNAYFNGAMDDIRIYKNALTEAQVKALYELEK